MLGLKVFEKVVLVLLVCIAVCTFTMLAVSFGVFESAYEKVQLSRFKFLATETKISIEYLLSLGLPFQPSATLEQLIDTVRAESSGVASVALLGANDRIIYSTDTGEIGEQLPGLLNSVIFQQDLGKPETWIAAEDAVAVLLENDFNQTLGAVLIRYEVVGFVSVMERALFFLGKLGLGIFACTALLVFLGIFLCLRRPIRAVLDLSEQLERLMGSNNTSVDKNFVDESGALKSGVRAENGRYLGALTGTFSTLKGYEDRVTTLDESA